MVPDLLTPITSKPVQLVIFPFGKDGTLYSTKLSQKEMCLIALAFKLSWFAGRAPFQIWTKKIEPSKPSGLQPTVWGQIFSAQIWNGARPAYPDNFKASTIGDASFWERRE